MWIMYFSGFDKQEEMLNKSNIFFSSVDHECKTGVQFNYNI